MLPSVQISSSNLNPVSITLHRQEYLMETLSLEKEMSFFFSLQVIFVDKTTCNSHPFKKIYDFATTQYATTKSEFLSIFYQNPWS